MASVFGSLDTTHALTNTQQFCWEYKSRFSLRKSMLLVGNTVLTGLMDGFVFLTKVTFERSVAPPSKFCKERQKR